MSNTLFHNVTTKKRDTLSPTDPPHVLAAASSNSASVGGSAALRESVLTCWNRLSAATGTCAPPLVQYIYAGATIYAGAVTLFLLYTATRVAILDRQRQGEESQDDAVFLYSSDELKKSNGRGKKMSSSTMKYMSSSRLLVRLLLPLIIMYGVLLVWSYEPDMIRLILPGSLKDGFSAGFNPQFFPNINGIATLFSRTITAASLWVHILCINVFAANTLMWNGIDMGIPTQHTIIISMIFGPLGFLSHWITSKIFR